MLLGHSALDFNMAYASFGGFIWLLLALLITPLRLSEVNYNSVTNSNFNLRNNLFVKLITPASSKILIGKIQIASMVFIAIIIFFVNIQPLNAINNYRKSVVLNEQQQTAESFDVIKQAYKADPQNVDIIIYYTRFLNEIIVTETNQAVKEQFLQEAYTVLNKASEQYPYNTRIKNQLIDMNFVHGYSINAIEVLNQLIEIAPYTPAHYDRNIEVSYRVAAMFNEQYKQEVEQNPTTVQSKEQAKKYWQQAVNTYEQYLELHQALLEQQKPNEWQFRIQKQTRLYAALSYFFLDKADQAIDIIETVAPDKGISSEIQQTVKSDNITDELIQKWITELP
jgi:tetratricopeptide (TPR) repeat protein